MRMLAMRTVVMLLLIFPVSSLATHAADCATLSAVKLPNTTVTTAQAVPAGRFTPPSGRPIDKLPTFCRLAGVIWPTADSEIRFELWMPASDWNGKFLSVGNGGLAISGAGKGGGGDANTTLGGTGNKGRGGGRVGTGLGAAGNGTGIVGGQSRMVIRSGGPEEAVVMGAIARPKPAPKT